MPVGEDCDDREVYISIYHFEMPIEKNTGNLYDFCIGLHLSGIKGKHGEKEVMIGNVGGEDNAVESKDKSLDKQRSAADSSRSCAAAVALSSLICCTLPLLFQFILKMASSFFAFTLNMTFPFQIADECETPANYYAKKL